MKLSLLSLGYGLPTGVVTAMAGGIFVATLALIMLRPKQLNEALAALAGGSAMIAAGIVSPLQAIQTLLGDWNIFLFFLGMLTLSALAERAGFFDWLVAQAARLANGNTRRLYLNVFLLGTPASAIRQQSYFRYVATVLGLVAVAYLVISLVQQPLSLVAVGGAALLLIGALRWEQVQ